MNQSSEPHCSYLSSTTRLLRRNVRRRTTPCAEYPGEPFESRTTRTSGQRSRSVRTRARNPPPVTAAVPPIAAARSTSDRRGKSRLRAARGCPQSDVPISDTVRGCGLCRRALRTAGENVVDNCGRHAAALLTRSGSRPAGRQAIPKSSPCHFRSSTVGPAPRNAPRQGRTRVIPRFHRSYDYYGITYIPGTSK